jgi:predicted ABC-type ATPase
LPAPNGAGKTTSASKLLPDVLDCIEFVNADFIARGISPYNPESVAFQAGRVMLQRIRELMSEGKDFAIETTLSTLSYKGFIEKCKAAGYEIILIYIWLESPDLAINRVEIRVEKGGHDIPSHIIERRYFKGLRNLFRVFVPLCSRWIIVDNSEDELKWIAASENGKLNICNNYKFNLIEGHD